MTRAQQLRFQGLFVTSCLVRWSSTLWTLALRSSEAVHESKSDYCCFHPILRECNNVDWVWSLLSKLWSPRDCRQYWVQLCSWQGGWTFSILVGGNQKNYLEKVKHNCHGKNHQGHQIFSCTIVSIYLWHSCHIHEKQHHYMTTRRSNWDTAGGGLLWDTAGEPLLDNVRH